MVAPGPMAYPCAGPWPQAGGQPGGGVRGRFGPGLCRRRRRHRRRHAVGERLQSGGQLRGVVDWGRGGNGTPRGRTGARPMIKGGKASPRSFDWKLAKRAVGLERKQPGFLRGGRPCVFLTEVPRLERAGSTVREGNSAQPEHDKGKGSTSRSVCCSSDDGQILVPHLYDNSEGRHIGHPAEGARAASARGVAVGASVPTAAWGAGAGGEGRPRTVMLGAPVASVRRSHSGPTPPRTKLESVWLGRTQMKPPPWRTQTPDGHSGRSPWARASIGPSTP